MKEGLDERKIEKPMLAQQKIRKKRPDSTQERKSKVAKKERVKKEDKDAINASVVSKYAKDVDVEE